MKVEIWSDVMCPFCYLGKKHFEKALQQVPFSKEVQVIWKSFQLDPLLPDEGLTISTTAYLIDRKGMPHQQLETMMEHIRQSGIRAGIDFRQDISIPVNTFSAHRLIHFARKSGKDSEMEEALFEAHFTKGQNVGNHEELVTLAEKIGLNKAEVTEFLKGTELTDEVRDDMMEARDLGITGVPFFVIDSKYTVSGAQPVEVFVSALSETFRESQAEPGVDGNERKDLCGDEECDYSA
ncbi:MAG: DsbA family oxidoreductase [Bacteroidia bacterium]|nr:DsbA family oxidoreductase [Bacteroidia bacterium]MCZ2278203.1 DsbA family oxidoreductase [Bacteroidia bacterium]